MFSAVDLLKIYAGNMPLNFSLRERRRTAKDGPQPMAAVALKQLQAGGLRGSEPAIRKGEDSG